MFLHLRGGTGRTPAQPTGTLVHWHTGTGGSGPSRSSPMEEVQANYGSQGSGGWRMSLARAKLTPLASFDSPDSKRGKRGCCIRLGCLSQA